MEIVQKNRPKKLMHKLKVKKENYSETLIKIRYNIKDKAVITCSDRSFYCINRNKRHY